MDAGGVRLDTAALVAVVEGIPADSLYGLLVRVVEEGGPADRAGLRSGDLVVEAGDRAVADADELYEVLDQVGEGQSLTLRVVRGTDELTVTVNFGDSGAERRPRRVQTLLLVIGVAAMVTNRVPPSILTLTRRRTASFKATRIVRCAW